MQKTEEDWGYRTEPSAFSCQGMKGGRCTWPRGKALGGTSTINAMQYVRGNKRDYDTWAELGNPTWDYNSVLTDFRKFEKWLVPELTDAGYGTSGELGITKYTCEQPIRSLIEKTAENLGIPTRDVEDKFGYFDTPLTVEGGTRSNTAKAFLGTVKHRKNLKVALNAHATRIIFDENTAKGVEVKIGDKLLTLKTRKEIIISAGSINSPQLLMLSGIGPRDHLETLNIKVIRDLPVGENLQDHVTTCGVYLKIEGDALIPLQPHEVLTELYKYFAFQTGEFTGISLTNFVGFINTKNLTDYPSLQILHTVHFQNDDYLLKTMWSTIEAEEEIWKSLSEFNKRYNMLGVYPTLLQPKSVGKIVLNTNDPFEHPLIYSNYFTDENSEDVKTIVEGIRFLQKLIATEPLSQYNPEILRLNIPNCKELIFDSDEYWECVVRNTAKTLYHPIGTCKMGPKSDPTAVVDSTLKVHGVKGLRVVDASIMPKIVSANTNAASILIGQKGADFIIRDYQGRHEEL